MESGKMKYRLSLLILVLFSSLSLFSQTDPSQIDLDAVEADRAFSAGVRSFHNGEIASALLSFERSLSYKPDRMLSRYWLGNCYERMGYINSALREWEEVLDSQYATAALKDRYEALKSQVELAGELSPPLRFVEVDAVAGRQGEYSLFMGPTSVYPRSDGGLYIASFASNEVVSLGINGTVRSRIRGGLEGLNRPFDIITGPQGRLFISEYKGDRIVRCRPDGRDLFRFAGRGRGDGELLGPQYLAFDNEGYLYVSEQGNRRISKFDTDGTFLLSFGSADGVFPGFREPTGIAVSGETVYVADSRRKTLYLFDLSGNYLGKSGEGLFHAPESVRNLENGILLISDTDRLVLFNPSEEILKVLVELEEGSKLVSSAFDVNGHLLLGDFSENRLLRYADFHHLYGSLLVRVERVIESRFPSVAMEVSVRSRRGSPLVGLESGNFLLSEGRIEADAYEFLGSVDSSEESAVAIVAERSREALPYLDAFGEGIERLGRASQGRCEFSFVSAGEMPLRDVESAVSSDPLNEALLQGADDLSDNWSCDTALRLAASGLLNRSKKRALVLFTSGVLSPESFERYSLVDLARFFSNNFIRLYVVIPRDKEVPRELAYLTEKSGGAVIPLFRSQGLGPLVNRIADQQDGRYILGFNSRLDPDLGRAYLPLEVQAFLHGRSGRGESAYYAPLQ